MYLQFGYWIDKPKEYYIFQMRFLDTSISDIKTVGTNVRFL